MPSAKAVWASWGVSTMSPTAPTPGTVVRHRASTSTNPDRRPRLRRRPAPGPQCGAAAPPPPPPPRRRPACPPRRRRRCRSRPLGAHGRAPSHRCAPRCPACGMSGAPPWRRRCRIGEDGGERLQHGHAHAQVAHHRSELATYGTPSDDHRRRGQSLQEEQLVGGHHDAAVHLEAADRAGRRPRGQDDRRGGRGNRGAPAVGDHLNRPGPPPAGTTSTAPGPLREPEPE